jgi:23S rRNA G2445 N2-methylase RlmL
LFVVKLARSVPGNLFELVDPMTNMGVLLIESTLTKQPTKGNQDFAIQTWSLLDLELSLKGTLPENAVRTVN